jgi:co-chaperonin GroES (HSP10)
MNLKPLGDRVLIKPFAPPEQTESGLHLVEHKKPEQVGQVVAVGTPSRDSQIEALNALVGWSDDRASGESDFEEAVKTLRAFIGAGPCCQVGDTVLFSWAAGQEIFLHDDDARYLLMKEDDLIAVLET